jgi:hypothetical protein
MKQVYQNISEPPTLRNQGAENLRIECVGSPIGRFIFTDWAQWCVSTLAEGFCSKTATSAGWAHDPQDIAGVQSSLGKG